MRNFATGFNVMPRACFGCVYVYGVRVCCGGRDFLRI